MHSHTLDKLFMNYIISLTTRYSTPIPVTLRFDSLSSARKHRAYQFLQHASPYISPALFKHIKTPLLVYSIRNFFSASLFKIDHKFSISLKLSDWEVQSRSFQENVFPFRHYLTDFCLVVILKLVKLCPILSQHSTLSIKHYNIII